MVETLSREWQMVLLTAATAAALPLGAALAAIPGFGPDWLQREFRHFVIAVGAGVMLGAAAVSLVPEGQEAIGNPALSVAWLLAGGLLIFGLERWINRQRRAEPQLMGMLLDFVPENLALGGLVMAKPEAAWALAWLIGLQNLPEGFNSFRELSQTGSGRWRNFLFMLMLVALGPILGLVGMSLLGEHKAWLGAVMLASSGGILYLMFQDIAPQVKLERHWAPPLGAVLGFGISMLSV